MNLDFKVVAKAQERQPRGNYSEIAAAVERLTDGQALEIEIPEDQRKTDFRAKIFSSLRNRGMKVRTSLSADRSKIWVWLDRI